MNREIKFCAWDNEKKRMSNPFSPVDMFLTWNDGDIDMPLPFAGVKSYRFELLQFTGLKDKDSKEIFEGDILFCHEYDSSDVGRRIIQSFKNAVVGFENCSFYYYPKGNMRQPHQLLMYAYKPEVIGNIYENPELLK